MVIALLQQPFWFLRHGETAANAADIIAGSTDSPLTRRGHAQAHQAARLLKDQPLAAIWTSPLSRARLTAQAVAQATGAPLVTLPGLAERDWGTWEGQPRHVLRRDATPPEGEGPETFRHRIREALGAIVGPFPVLIVAHSGTARELHALLCPDPIGQPFQRPGNAVPLVWRPGPDGHWSFAELSPDCQRPSLGQPHLHPRSF
ncbi:histidine phosphatase family protein [Plastorhodobacter daqingensis]|uniref:Histidine phosphatase family protein n=1 Tax=Plastorhodobacter daqingensis TaxID=1387281 RepID=A0ABW2UM55_9RHOB